MLIDKGNLRFDGNCKKNRVLLVSNKNLTFLVQKDYT